MLNFKSPLSVSLKINVMGPHTYSASHLSQVQRAVDQGEHAGAFCAALVVSAQARLFLGVGK